MSDHIETRIDELQTEAWGLPHSKTKVALLEEAVRLVDTLGDIERGYEMRDELMEAATYSGRNDLMLVAFSWCLAQFDKQPDLFNEYDLLWKYKWIVSNAVDFPELSRKQVEDLLADMTRRYKEGGFSMHAPLQSKRDVCVSMGDREGAREAHEAFVKTRRDILSDCDACVPSCTARYHLLWGREKLAITAVKSVLSGKKSCMEEPRKTYAEVLLPLMKLGRIEEARNYHALGYKTLLKEDHAIEEIAYHLQFVALLGDLAKARRIFERHLPGALATVSQLDRYRFFMAGLIYLERLRAKGKSTVKIRLPESAPPPNAKGESDIDELSAWLTKEALAIARKYDARNGNDYYTARLNSLPKMLELAV